MFRLTSNIMASLVYRACLKSGASKYTALICINLGILCLRNRESTLRSPRHIIVHYTIPSELQETNKGYILLVIWKMAQQIIQNLSEDFFHCSICMERFKKPLMLPCLHTFCLHCLKIYESKVQREQFSCPVCRRPVELSDEGVEELPKNFFLSNLMDRLDLIQKLTNETSSKCDFCRRNMGLLFCLDCQLYICSICKDVHTRIPGTGDHVIISAEKLTDEEYLKQIISTKTPLCDDHKDEKLRFYCRECSQWVCRDCTVVSHQGHECVKAESEASSAKERLEELLKESTEESQQGLELSESLETSLKSLESQATKMLKLVDCQFDESVEKLKSDREALKKKIENMKGKKCRPREKTKEELTDVLQAMKNIQDVTRRVLEGNNLWEILRMEKDIVSSFEGAKNDIESKCEKDSQSDDSSSEDYDSDRSSSANDSSDSNEDKKSDSSDGSSDANDSNDDEKDKKNGSVKILENDEDQSSDDDDDDDHDDDDTDIGIKFIPSKIKPPNRGAVVRSTSNWRKKNHVGKIVRS